jgi:uncharacterized damage-inducible protein DinB
MTKIQWFDREFDFSFGMERYVSLYDRLQNAPGLFYKAVSQFPETFLQLKPNDKWSVKENIGHLFLLESLWRKRLVEIKEKAHEMSPADLSNTATDKALFNKEPLHEILENFRDERNKTMALLGSLQQEDFSHTIIHPRLQKPMRVIDLMHFVAEHDDHHLNTIQDIIKNNTL